MWTEDPSRCWPTLGGVSAGNGACAYYLLLASEAKQVQNLNMCVQLALTAQKVLPDRFLARMDTIKITPNKRFVKLVLLGLTASAI